MSILSALILAAICTLVLVLLLVRLLLPDILVAGFLTGGRSFGTDRLIVICLSIMLFSGFTVLFLTI